MQESRQTNLGLRAELARVEELLTQREDDLAELRRALPVEGGLNGASPAAARGVDDGVHALIEGAGGALDRGDPEELEMFLRDCVNKLREVAGACKEADEAGAQGTAQGESLQAGLLNASTQVSARRFRYSCLLDEARVCVAQFWRKTIISSARNRVKALQASRR